MRTHLRLHIANIHHADDGDGRRERNSIPRYVAVAQLAEKRHSRPLGQAIHLVEEKDERLFRPLRKHRKE